MTSSSKVLTSFLVSVCALDLCGVCGGEFGICATSCEWDHWENIGGVQS